MKLTAYKAAHGLDGVLASKATGERVHFRFERGQTRVPLILTIGGFQLEAALELEPATGDDQVDLRLVLVTQLHPGQVLSPARGIDGGPELKTAKAFGFEKVRRVKNTRIEMAEDGAPLTPPGPSSAPEDAPGVESDEAMGPRSPTSPLALRSIPDPAAVVLDGTDPVSGAPAIREKVTSDQVVVPDHDDTPPVAPPIPEDTTVTPQSPPAETPLAPPAEATQAPSEASATKVEDKPARQAPPAASGGQKGTQAGRRGGR